MYRAEATWRQRINGGLSHLRKWIWSAAGFLLLLPLLAMQFTHEVMWDETDFSSMGVLLAFACGACEVTARMTGSRAYRGAVAVAVAAGLILVWMNLAVGIIGSEDHPANLIYGVVLAIGVIGAAAARFQPQGMTRALFVTALAQTVIGGIAAIAGLGQSASPPLELLALNGFFAALWLTAAWLFRRAAQEQASPGR